MIDETDDDDLDFQPQLIISLGEFVTYSIGMLDVQAEAEGLLGVMVGEDGVLRGLSGYTDRHGKYKQEWFRVGIDPQPLSYIGPKISSVN